MIILNEGLQTLLWIIIKLNFTSKHFFSKFCHTILFNNASSVYLKTWADVAVFASIQIKNDVDRAVKAYYTYHRLLTKVR